MWSLGTEIPPGTNLKARLIRMLFLNDRVHSTFGRTDVVELGARLLVLCNLSAGIPLCETTRFDYVENSYVCETTSATRGRTIDGTWRVLSQLCGKRLTQVTVN